MTPSLALRLVTRSHSVPSDLYAQMPVNSTGAPAQVTTAKCFVSSPSSNLHNSLQFDSSFLPKILTTPPPPYSSTVYPISPPSSPLDISELAIKDLTLGQFVPKPLLTPRSSATDTVTTTVLTCIFPTSSPIHSLSSKVIDLNSLVPNWSGAVLDNPAMGTRTLYVSGGSYDDVNLRESVCGVLEKAEEELGCTGVVMCLEKNTPDLGDLLHSLMYVGGTISNGPFTPQPAFILVGLDL